MFRQTPVANTVFIFSHTNELCNKLLFAANSKYTTVQKSFLKTLIILQKKSIYLKEIMFL